MLSIIIPTLNEEKYLPRLLDSVKKQSYKNYEIIVADNNSRDKTVQAAKKYGCKVVNGGNHPGISRNAGAKYAKGSILLFLDADSIIEQRFIKNSLEDIKKRKLDVAGCYLCPSTSHTIDMLFLKIFNLWIFSTQIFYPNACGTGIFCKKWLHEKISGFDEKIKLSEDMDYVKRCSKFGKFRIIKNSKVIYSMRRYDAEGRFNVGLRLLLSVFYRLIFGEIRNDVFKYNFRYKK